MIKTNILLSAFLCITMSANAQVDSLKGFVFGRTIAPDGKEWESPERLSLNKELPRSYFFSFHDVESARKVLPENSRYWQSLDGMWRFKWSPDPDSRPADFWKKGYDTTGWDEIEVPSNWNIYGLGKDGSQKYGTPVYVNQPVIFYHKVEVDDWRGGVMRTPPKTWTTYETRNEVGSFLRTFTVPEDWKKREIFINFDGVDSFFYLWINGKYIGFSKNSRNTASFRISDYLMEGENTVSVEVYRTSDGSFLESQDMFRLPGIFRSVYLTSSPYVHIRNLEAVPELDSHGRATLRLSADIRNTGNRDIRNLSLTYSLYENTLFSDENSKIDYFTYSQTVKEVPSGEEIRFISEKELAFPKIWSAEHPYRYTIVAQLKDKKGNTIETVSSYIGFREVEIRESTGEEDEFGLAGRYFYINDKTVKLKGVNRHETNPAAGHVVSRERMKEEIMLMKRANINHVRNSHYPDDPYWYYLCDKYGIYLEDEANIESHQYYYGKASLSHPKEWEAAHVARVMEMVHAHINHPSIVIWSLGNEAGPGRNFVSAYNALKTADTSRPVQYERNNDIVDMGSNQYPSIAWVRGAVKGEYDIKYPFHISEYAHSMGNACGNLKDYWEAIESTNFFCGGAIWDWVDQAMYAYTPEGKRYFAYGGDFGDFPNDGQFVMNGIMFADLSPKPQYFETKKVYQHIDTKATDIRKGEFEIFNKYYFQDFSDFSVTWSLYKDGIAIDKGSLDNLEVCPRKKILVQIHYDYNKLESDSEYFIKFQYILNKRMPWADKGYPMAEEQIKIKEATLASDISESAGRNEGMYDTYKRAGLEITDSSISDSACKIPFTIIKGENFNVVFDNEEGTIHSLDYSGNIIFREGDGPRLSALRAFVNNDNWIYESWFKNGLHNLSHKARRTNLIKNEDNSISIYYSIVSQAPNGASINGGASSGHNSITEHKDIPFSKDDFRFTSNVVWTVYQDGSIEFRSNICSNNDKLILPRIGYTMKLPARYDKYTYYGRGPANNYNDRMSGQFIEIYEQTVDGQFVNFPKPQDMANREDVRWCALTDGSALKNCGTCNGAVFIATGRMSAAALPYSALDMTLAGHPNELKKSGVTYLNLDAKVTGLGGYSCGQGGPLTEDRAMAGEYEFGFIIRPSCGELQKITKIKGSLHLPEKVRSESSRITSVRLAGVSSAEPGNENCAENLVDGDNESCWTSMHSVTVAKYPHWIDLDMGQEVPVKGLVYISKDKERSISDFEIYLSSDGQNWGKAVLSGKFQPDLVRSEISLPGNPTARYVRIQALSANNGGDVVSCNELKILAE